MPDKSSISASPEQSSSSIGTGSISGKWSSSIRAIHLLLLLYGPPSSRHSFCARTSSQLRQLATKDCHRCVITIHHKKNERSNKRTVQTRSTRRMERDHLRCDSPPFLAVERSAHSPV